MSGLTYPQEEAGAVNMCDPDRNAWRRWLHTRLLPSGAVQLCGTVVEMFREGNYGLLRLKDGAVIGDVRIWRKQDLDQMSREIAARRIGRG